MLNAIEIADLESRWKKWKIKSFAKNPFVIFGAILIFIIIIGVFYLIINQLNFTNATSFQEKNTTLKQAKTQSTSQQTDLNLVQNSNQNIVSQTFEDLTQETTNTNKSKKYQSPFTDKVFEFSASNSQGKRIVLAKPKVDLNFDMEDIEEKTPQYKTNTNFHDKTSKFSSSNSNIKIESQDSKINIQTNKINDYESLKKKFYESDNIHYALMLAEEYYHKKDYKQALKWSIRANNLDSKNERSWIIFAKSLSKNGSHDKAIKSLKAYLKSNPNSADIQILLEKLENKEDLE